MNKTYKEVQEEWDNVPAYTIGYKLQGELGIMSNDVKILHARDDALRKALLEEIRDGIENISPIHKGLRGTLEDRDTHVEVIDLQPVLELLTNK